MSQEDAKERESRSVNDFHSAADIERALSSMDIRRSHDDDGPNINFMDPVLQENIGGPLARIDENAETANVPDSMDGVDKSLDWVLENFDEQTTEAQSLSQELRRLQVLKSYLILDSERQESFERVTGLASRIFKCPMALVSLVDLGRQWFMSNRGLGETRETKRKYAFCAHVIMGKEDFLIVPDATKDPRFRENPLVTGPPHIRFYAGAPLISPEGYKLGTLCVLDIKPRPQGISLEEKQNLMELAALAVQAAVDHRRRKAEDFNNPAQLIAYTAHDLLTPLTGVQLSLSLLMEDEDFSSKLTPHHREMISTASSCTDMMGRICQTAIDTFRTRTKEEHFQIDHQLPTSAGPAPIAISDLVKSLYMVMDPFPKNVPLIITVHPAVPDAIITDDLKVFRATINFLTNACAKTETGSVHLSISTKTESSGGNKLVVECEDTGPGVPVEKYPHLFRPYKDDSAKDDGMSCLLPDAAGGFASVSKIQMPNSGLGLYSVAVNISSIGGQYGYRPRVASDAKTANGNGKHVSGSIFWFNVPLIVPDEKGTIDMNRLSSSFRSLGSHDGITPGKLVRVLSTPSLSEEDANKVYDTFTKVLEGDMPSGLATTVEPIDDFVKPEAKPILAIPVVPGESRKIRALVIEDSLVVRKSLTRVLTKLGFETAQAVDGMEGLKELKNTLFDVVLCDFLMPVMDGLDCVQQYREWETENRSWFRQYIIGISAHASENDTKKGFEVGMDDFKPKPVTFKQLSELQKSKKLKEVSHRLDEIAGEGMMMVDCSQENANDAIMMNSSHEAVSRSHEAVKVPHVPDPSSGDTSIHYCLIAVENTSNDFQLVAQNLEKKGWKAVIVNNGNDALRLLKMRNWDAVLLDDDLPVLSSSVCVARFREWEEKNRVTRQKSVVLVSTSFMSFANGSKSMVQLPFGFDFALGKPIRMEQLEYILKQAERSATDFGVRDIVSR